MDPRTLQLFLAVVNTGSLLEAAEKTCFAPATASRRLAELERSLGVQLLDRGCRPLEPTECGRAFRFHAQEILQAIQLADVAMAKIAQRGQPSGR